MRWNSIERSCLNSLYFISEYYEMSTFWLNTKNEVETLVHALRETLFDSIYIHRRHEISRTIMNSLIIQKQKQKKSLKIIWDLMINSHLFSANEYTLDVCDTSGFVCMMFPIQIIIYSLITSIKFFFFIVEFRKYRTTFY